MGVGPVGFSVEQRNLLWVMWRRGDSIREMERTLGETLTHNRFCCSTLNPTGPTPIPASTPHIINYPA